MNKRKNCAVQYTEIKDSNDRNGCYRVVMIDEERLDIVPVNDSVYQDKETAIEEAPKGCQIIEYDDLMCDLLKLRKDKLRKRECEIKSLKMKS